MMPKLLSSGLALVMLLGEGGLVHVHGKSALSTQGFVQVKLG